MMLSDARLPAKGCTSPPDNVLHECRFARPVCRNAPFYVYGFSFFCLALQGMKQWSYILPFAFFLSFGFHSAAQGQEGVKVRAQVVNGDTVLMATIREINVFAPMQFRNKREERFYWRTVRDVKRTLPYARKVAAEVMEANRQLLSLPDDEARKAYMNRFEKELFRKYEGDLRKMTFSQGKMLIKLIDRECDSTSYELIRIYRGKFSAFFWQGFAKIFGADLKTEYDTSKYEDRVIERIIVLVEAGML